MNLVLQARRPGSRFRDSEAGDIAKALDAEVKQVDREGSVAREELGVGEFGAVDPNVMDFLIALSSGTLVLVIEKFVDYFARRAKTENSAVQLTVGNTTTEVRPDANLEDVRTAAAALVQAAERNAQG